MLQKECSPAMINKRLNVRCLVDCSVCELNVEYSTALHNDALSWTCNLLALTNYVEGHGKPVFFAHEGPLCFSQDEYLQAKQMSHSFN